MIDPYKGVISTRNNLMRFNTYIKFRIINRIKTVVLLILVSINLQSQSFEGYLHGNMAGKEISLYIWSDLRIPETDGIVTGSYFYKNIGKEIILSGNKRGKQITLTEKDKNQKTTGTFLLHDNNGNLEGIWLKHAATDTLNVELYRTNPSIRNTAFLPRIKDLLAEEIEFYSAGLDSNYVDEAINYQILFARSNLLCIELNWENYSYTAHYGTLHYTYNLETSGLIDLKEDITDSCVSYLCNALQEIVTANREEYTDSEWIEGLTLYIEGYSYGDSSKGYLQAAQEKIEELFTVTTLPQKTELYVDENGLNCFILDYCEQYFTAGNRGMTFDCLVTIPFDRLKAFIKKESILQNLFY